MGKHKPFPAFLAILLLLSACRSLPAVSAAENTPPLPVSQPEEQSDEPEPEPMEPPKEIMEGPTTDEYLAQVVSETIERFLQPEMSEYEKVKAAFDYVIETGYYTLPIAPDIWRIRSTGDRVPSYIENRGLGILLFGTGACEDYASAMVLLLEGMGIEARYVPGFAYSRRGSLVHHAWNQVKIDGVWYNFDCELEDGISQGTVRYRYFLKSDATMSASHFWGQRLIDTGRLQEDQNAEIAEFYLMETCPQDYPTPAPKEIPVTLRPDESAIYAGLREELQEYETRYGKLEPIELNLTPVVFGRYHPRLQELTREKLLIK